MKNSSIEAGEAAGHFDVPGEFVGAEPFGTGHINDSYRVAFRCERSVRHYLLQRINTRVFTNPGALMQNMERVTTHIAGLGVGSVAERLTLIPSRDGSSFYIDRHGGCWRMTHFIEGSQALERISCPQQAFQVASAFGRFQMQVSTLPPPRLNDTIPDFHNTPKRFAAMEKAIDSADDNKCQMENDK